MTVAASLFIALCLMGMVMLYMAQRFFIQSDTDRGIAIARMLVKMIGTHGLPETGSGSTVISTQVDRLMREENLAAVTISGNQLKKDYQFGSQVELIKQTSLSAHRLIKTGKEEISYCASSWNLFLKPPKVSIVSLAIEKNGGRMGAAAFAIPLENAFQHIKIIQEFFLLYLFVNTFLFSVIAVSRVSRFIVRPMRKLIQRATQYRDGDGPLLPYEGGGSEWDTLSRAVNRIVDLNMRDNQILSETVASLRQAMADLEKAQQEMIRAEKLATVGRLSSGIAHEIGNPIGIILGYLELLQQASFPESEKGDIVRRTETQVRRIDHIMRQLLDFSRPGKTNISMVSVHEVVTEIIEMIRLQPIFSNIVVKESLCAALDVVMADHGQLHQAFLNLILNAADAIAENSRQRNDGIICVQSENICAWEAGGLKKPAIKLSFIDNGEGICPEYTEKIFDPFFTTKAPGKGTGLGLWVSFMIVEGLDGTIRVDSTVGEGTTMSVYLPVADAITSGERS